MSPVQPPPPSFFEVDTPILNSPFEEPKEYWDFNEGEFPRKTAGRRPAGYYYRDPQMMTPDGPYSARGVWQELTLVKLIRERLKAWSNAGYPGASRVTRELLAYWKRDGRGPNQRLFFAQHEGAETIIFLTEARADFLQGIDVPPDEPTGDRREQGFQAFRRYACKMATGTGKTMVMGMLAAWSILNKVNDRSDSRFSDVVLVVCPNVTIKTRLQELDPNRGEASIYRTRDLVPESMMTDLTKGRVLITNWHVFEPQSMTVGDTSARVLRAGVPVTTTDWIYVGQKNETARGKRYLTLEHLNQQIDAGMVIQKGEERDKQGNLVRVKVKSTKHVESDRSLLNKVLGREVGGKQNILVFNDEAHHAYRIGKVELPDGFDEEDDEDEDEDYDKKEATVWIDGLDKIHKHRGVNFCLDLSATPFYLARVGQETNRNFPWVVSDFGLTDAIESGLTKIPQLALQDATGQERAEYFNIWRWILKNLTSAERGGTRASPRPDAVLKWSHHPLMILASKWQETMAEWKKDRPDDPRPPVFIIVCKNTAIAKVLYAWLAENKAPIGVSSVNVPEFRNLDGVERTIRVDTKVVHETDTGEAKSDEFRWMRLTLDTVGKLYWPRDSQGSPIFPEGFEELAKKLNRPLHPPGRDVQCIVSVGMLTEGWDCNTVTHIVGLRPFMSQLLCEQVVGRGLRRTSYEVNEDGKFEEEIASILGVPFEIIPFKKSQTGGTRPPERRHRVRAIPEKAAYEIKFPRVVGYRQAIRNRITVDWDSIAPITVDPLNIPDEVLMKATVPNRQGRHSLIGPGKLDEAGLDGFRRNHRLQELAFELARDLTRDYSELPSCEAPPHVLFPQVAQIAIRFVNEKITIPPNGSKLDVFLSPYYGWAAERLVQAIRPDAGAGESPEIPKYETSRGPGSTAEVDFWTAKEVREVVHSHLNYVVADTRVWEQSAAHYIDRHRAVKAFVKNDHLGFAVPYFHNGEFHDYIPDFIIRLNTDPVVHLILESKGFDELAEVKMQAAQRWVDAVNAEGSHGIWRYAVAWKPTEAVKAIDQAVNERAAPSG
jgi:type III restriction enzyme